MQVSLDRGAAQDLLVALTSALGDGGGKTSKGPKSTGKATKSTKTTASKGAKSAKK